MVLAGGFEELCVITPLGASKQVVTIRQLHFNRSPLAVERLVGRAVANAVDGAEVAHYLRVNRIQIIESRGVIQRRPARLGYLAQLLARLRVRRARHVITLYI